MKTSKWLTLISVLLIAWSMAGCAPSQRNEIDGKILFQSNRDGNYGLYVINPDGSNQRKIDDFPNRKISPDDSNGFFPSPDGKKIAFSSDRDGNSEIYAIDIDSWIKSNLTKNKAHEFWFTWSPDGKQIAFVSSRDTVLARGTWTNNIYIMDADGANVRRVTVDNKTNQYGELSWSPDGKNLALDMSLHSSQGPVVSLIYLMTLSDAKLTELTSTADAVQGIEAWSPDGKHILYSVSRSMSNNIYVMNADGTNQVALSNDALGIVVSASWSPDGNRIVFSTLQFQVQDNSRKYYIYTVNADGTNLVTLSKDPSSYDTSPSWSPDGKYIVFASQRDGGKSH
jgi:TolB protein